MKYKKGDKVRVREWEAMERKFRLSPLGFIETKKGYFLPDMKEYCGKVVTIREMRYDFYRIEEDNGFFDWSDDMFEGYAFGYGDWIEVRNDGNDWKKRIYVGYIDGALFPYACVADCDEERFYSGEVFSIYYWKYARPIQKHTITIDGKEIEISEESYKKLKESLLK